MSFDILTPRFQGVLTRIDGTTMHTKKATESTDVSSGKPQRWSATQQYQINIGSIAGGVRSDM